MVKIIGTCHVGLLPGWVGIVKAQYKRLKDSGLLDQTSKVLVGTVCDPNKDVSLITDLLGSKAVVRHVGGNSSFEFPTLQWLYEEIRSEEAACWYVHTKGNFTVNDNQPKWRMEMESVVFDQYEKCLESLKTYDTCGTRWQLDGMGARNPHYSGNFWWANSSYLRTLPPPITLRSGKYGRLEAEFWIGKNRKIRACNLAAPRQPFDQESAWVGLESKYRDLLGDMGQVRRVVDLGVDYGFSTFQFALHYPDAEVIGISDFTLHDDSEAWVRKQMRLFPNIRIIKGSTADVGRLFREPVDLLHIDADHEYETVVSDFTAWIPAVRPGGRVLFHDTRSFPATVGRFFKELEGEKREIPEHHGLGCLFVKS
jgi:hypothetical protein